MPEPLARGPAGPGVSANDKFPITTNHDGMMLSPGGLHLSTLTLPVGPERRSEARLDVTLSITVTGPSDRET